MPRYLVFSVPLVEGIRVEEGDQAHWQRADSYLAAEMRTRRDGLKCGEERGWHATHEGSARSLARKSAHWARLVEAADSKE